MARKRHTAEQIIGLLQQAEVELAQRRTVGELRSASRPAMKSAAK
jgi:hypothetical protein